MRAHREGVRACVSVFAVSCLAYSSNNSNINDSSIIISSQQKQLNKFCCSFTIHTCSQPDHNSFPAVVQAAKCICMFTTLKLDSMNTKFGLTQSFHYSMRQIASSPLMLELNLTAMSSWYRCDVSHNDHHFMKGVAKSTANFKEGTTSLYLVIVCDMQSRQINQTRTAA